MAEREHRVYEELDRLIDQGGTPGDAELAGLLATAGSVRASLAAPTPPAGSAQVAATLAATHRRAMRVQLLTLTLALIAAVVVAGTLGWGEQSGEPEGADRGQQLAPGSSQEPAPGSSGTRERDASDRSPDNGRGRRGAASTVEGYGPVKGDVLDVLGSDRPAGR